MAKINSKDLQASLNQDSLTLSSLIKKGQWKAVADQLNRICNTLPIIDEIIESEFVTAVLQEATDEYGTDELVSGGNLYLEDFKPLTENIKTIVTANGDTVDVKVVQCNTPYDSQVMDNYYDYLTLNSKKVLSVSITQEELTTRACGLETYNKLRDLILNKATQATKKFIRDRVWALINDSSNYKQVVEIPYTTESEDGENILAAITRFSSQLQLEPKLYNIAGRDYELNRKTGMWLIKSPNLETKLANVMSTKFNSTAIDIDSKFARTFEEVKFKLADGLIMDKQWIQVKQVKQNIYWDFNSKFLTECGNYHYWSKDKAVNFLMAVPFRLVKVDAQDLEVSRALSSKIIALSDPITATSQADAETKIKAAVEALNISDPKLNLEYNFSDYQANVSYAVSIVMRDSKGSTLNTTNKVFTLSA